MTTTATQIDDQTLEQLDFDPPCGVRVRWVLGIGSRPTEWVSCSLPAQWVINAHCASGHAFQQLACATHGRRAAGGFVHVACGSPATVDSIEPLR